MADGRNEQLSPASGDDRERPSQTLTVSPGLVETGPPPSASFLATLADRPGLVVVPLLALLAFALRFRGYDRLSLWQDEGWTVSYVRQSWPEVLGLRGEYDVHPPLYYALTKLAAMVVPEANAGRLVSVVAGALTVVAVYALVARLAGWLAALGAGLVLVVAPLHVWYSQEARMYALSVLLVALSYLTVALFVRGGSGWWMVGHALATLLAVYVDYSAAFALAPQGIILLALPRWYGRRVMWLWLSTIVAALGFLAWVPRLLASLAGQTVARDPYLNLAPGKIADSVLALVGLPGYASYYWGSVATPWVALPNLRLGFVAVVALAALTGGIALYRRAPIALAVALALGPGTIATALLVSLISPGYADRTVLYAALGWAILAGAAPLLDTEPWHRQAAIASLACVVGLTAVATQAVARDGRKQDYRALAGAVRQVEGFGLPLLTDGHLTDTFIDLYAAEPPPTQRLNIYDPQVRDRLAGVEAVWFANAPYAWNDHATWQAHLTATGFARVGGQTIAHPGVPDSLNLDLYARPTARLGTAVAIPAALAGEQRLPPTGTVEGDAPLSASSMPHLLTIRFAARAEGTKGRVTTTTTCLTDDGRTLPMATENTRAADIGDTAVESTLTVRCPAGATALRLVFRNEGDGEIALRDLEIAERVPR